ncbi:hypothetical protein K0M31_003661 [Melipona bicolor]|uniref:Uncharacterized protein n=1 Tax=Melipona bicolor TaxID=60889 RepID=A0AA40FXB9_9HYME|nr:hypothetical protein K0M31_003661 [Melipona bicolor]
MESHSSTSEDRTEEGKKKCMERENFKFSTQKSKLSILRVNPKGKTFKKAVVIIPERRTTINDMYVYEWKYD